MTFFGTALLAGVLVGVLSGIIGTLVILRQRAFFTVALTHATFPGGVIAAILGVNIVAGAGVMGVLLVVLMVVLGRIPRQGRQVAAGIVLSFGYALGVFLHSLNQQLPTKVESYLTGTILAISPTNLTIIGITLVATVIVLLLAWKPLLFSTFDRSGFIAAGHRESSVEVLSLLLITGAVAAMMPAIGSILAIAMIAAPAAAARLLTRNIVWMLPVASVLGAGSAVLGLYLSRWWGVAAGGAMALTATAVFVVALCLHRLRVSLGRPRNIETHRLTGVNSAT